MLIAHLFRNPALRAAFARIENDASGALVIAEAPKPVLSGGAVVRVPEVA